MNEYLHWNNPHHMMLIQQALLGNQAIIGPSDTVIGLFAAVTQQGFDKLNQIKGRFEKPYIVIISDRNQFSLFTDGFASKAAERLVEAAWPGPVTLVVPAKKNLPLFMQSKDRSIGLRIPDYQPIKQLADIVGPLFSTSANLAGLAVPRSVHDIDKAVVGHVAYIVEDEQQRMQPSTVLDCTQEMIKVLRVGAYPVQELEFIAGQSFLK